MLVHKGLEVGRNLLPTERPIVQDAGILLPGAGGPQTDLPTAGNGHGKGPALATLSKS
jgi:hypothetical protein